MSQDRVALGFGPSRHPLATSAICSFSFPIFLTKVKILMAYFFHLETADTSPAVGETRTPGESFLKVALCRNPVFPPFDSLQITKF